MFMKYRNKAVVPFEDDDRAQRVFVTDNGKVAIVGKDPDRGWWIETADDYDQGPRE